MSKYLVEMDDIEVSYPVDDGDRKVILKDLSLRISHGEFVTVIGPSGCGKSTLLRLILGSQFPTVGQVRVAGKSVHRVERERGIVYQRYSLLRNLTVLDNIACGPVLSRTSIPGMILQPWACWKIRQEERERARAFLDDLGLDADVAEKYPHELSGGMKQRVAIAQSINMRPDILLMDEPFSALDASTREEMQLFVLEQAEKHDMTVFFVTHEIEEAIFLGSRILGLSQYWSDDEDVESRPARIVVDKQIPGKHPRPTDWKYSPHANLLVQDVKRDTMDREHLQHVKDFDLSHADA